MVVIAASGLCAGLLSHGIDVLSKTGNITPGLPPFKVPSFSVSKGNTTISAGKIFTVSI